MQALGDEAREELGRGLVRSSEGEKKAREVRVRLRRDDGGRWVLR